MYDYDTQGFQKLNGRRVDAVRVAPDGEIIYFDTDDGVIAYKACGDCCSHSWFADVLNASALVGHTVVAVEDVPLDEVIKGLAPARAAVVTNDDRTEHDQLQYYAHRITTNAGQCDIVYRNDSNGYYGGWAEFDGSKAIPESAVNVADDWSA